MRLPTALRHARLAARLSFGDVAKAGNIDRSDLCHMEMGRKTATENLVRAYEKALGMNRREIIALAATSLGAALTPSQGEDTAEIYAAIATGDEAPLTTVQTTHAMDHAIQRLAARDRRSIGKLRHWLDDGHDAVLRVNAGGILAKTQDPELADVVALALARDAEARELYLTAVRRRVGTKPAALAAELGNERDAGARWCAAHLLAGTGHTAAIAQAMRTEPSRETLRHMALAATGALHDLRD